MSRRIQRTSPSSPRYFAGLDASLGGFGVVVGDHLGHVVERHILKPKTRGAERLDELQNRVRAILAPYEIELACIEGYATGSTNGKTFNIGELGGVIRLLLYRRHTPFMDPKPTQLKKFATGAGGGEGGSKDQVTLYCFKNWGFMAKDNNEADAFVLYRIAMALKGFWGNTPAFKHQREVINIILNPPPPKKKRKEKD